MPRARRLPTWLSGLLLALLLMAAASSFISTLPGQSAGQQPPRDLPVFRTVVDTVNVTCNVRDRQGRLIADLKKEDFEILEDKQRQKIRFFSRETDLPLNVGLLIDCSGSMYKAILEERNAALLFLDTVLRPGDAAFVLEFGQRVIMLQDFTDNRDLLARAFDRLRWLGGTRVYDAVYLAIRDKLSQREGRRTLILTTDGRDNLSRVTRDTVMNSAQRFDVVIYVIFYEGSEKRDSSVGRWAERSGGRGFSGSGLSQAFRQIAEELRTQYTIGYSSSNQSPNGRYRKIEVRATRPGLRVSARDGYFPVPAGTAPK
jgi:VWFA-related protein